MSRSFKMHAAGGHVKNARLSEKKDKMLWHRKFRSKMKQAIHMVVKNGWEDDSLDWDVPFFHRLQAGNVWDMQKDGKGWWFPRNHYRGKAFLDKPVRCVYIARPTQIEFISIEDKHHIIGK